MLASLVVLLLQSAPAQQGINARAITRAVTTKDALPPPAASTSPVREWGLTGPNAVAYEISIDSEVRHGGRQSAVIRCIPEACDSFGTIGQTIRAGTFRGKRIRLSAWVRSLHAGRANLWLRVDGFTAAFSKAQTGNRPVLDFDNMEDRVMTGTHDWTLQEIVLDVPHSAALIYAGLILDGGGQAWLDDVALEPVDPSVRRTTTYHKRNGREGSNWEILTLAKFPKTIQNAGFEQ